MAVIGSINSNKGGVGKTTTTVVLGELLAFLGKKTLIVDQDPQGNTSMQFHLFQKDSPQVENGIILPEQERFHIAELYRFRYRTQEEVRRLIRPAYMNNLFVLPSSHRHKLT